MKPSTQRGFMKKRFFWFLLFCSMYLQNVRCSDALQTIDSKNVDPVKVEEVLKMLDMILAELPLFIDQYELNSELTWSEWKKKYWLLAPVGAAILTLKFYFVLANILKSSTSNNVFIST